jgi:hypothetical protein
MAYPYFKITNNNIDFYFIYRTYYGLPYTIPCDLASFVCMLYEKEKNLYFEGLISCWANLQANNTSIKDEKFSDSINEETTNLIIEQTCDEFITKKEVDHRQYSKLIHNKLDELSNLYQNSIPNHSEDKLKAILGTLHKAFSEFLQAEIIYNVAILPLPLYQNIDRTYDRLIDHLPEGKYDNFRKFLNVSSPDRKSAEWFQKLLFEQHLSFEDLPHAVRKHFTFTSLKITHNTQSSFARCVDVNKIVELELTPKNLLSYFNHLINDNTYYSDEVVYYFQEIGLLKDEKILQLNEFESAIEMNLIDKDIYFPVKLFNLIDKEGGMLLPQIYTYCQEINGLFKLEKFGLGLYDLYTKNGNLIFSNLNLDDIEIVEKDNEIFSFYADNEGRKIFKKIIITDNGNPVQLQNLHDDIGNELFNHVFKDQSDDIDLFSTETGQGSDDLPF